jgi:hypothetical protein
MTPHRAGTRISRTSGETIFVFEFKRRASQSTSSQETFMDTIENFISDLILKAVHKAVPNLAPADDEKVKKVVQDFVVTGMDLAAVFFALRTAKAATKA